MVRQPGTADAEVDRPLAPGALVTDARLLDLRPLLQHQEDVAARLAAEPVRYVPAALLDALQGSWGWPEELPVTPLPVPRRATR